VRPSRALVLVDTSQSMGLSDLTGESSAPTRAEQAIAALQDGPLLSDLRQQHEVVV
jgi:hypothetical protein